MRSSKSQSGRFISFVGKMVLFLVLLIAASEIANEVYIRLVLHQSYLYRSEFQFQQYKKDVTVLFLGDSHPKSNLDPRLFPGSFNLTSRGENMMQTYYILQHYLEMEKLDIRLAVLEIDIHTFAPVGLDQFQMHSYWRKYLDYVELGRSTHHMAKFLEYRLSGEFSYINGVDDSIRVYRIYTGDIRGNFQLEKGHFIRNSDFSTWSNQVESAREKAEAHVVGKVRFDPLVSEYFHRILEILQQHGVDTVLVRYPVTHEYNRAVDYRMDIKGYYQTLDDFLAQNHFEVPILDYHDMYWDRLDYFANADHLNEKGAKAFTLVLMEDLQTLGMVH